jgi:hypothetical protein
VCYRLLFIGALLIATLRSSAVTPTTRPVSTRPATTTTAPSQDDKRLADLEAQLSRVLPKEVIDGKKEPTDEQKLIMQMLLFIQGGGGTVAERAEQAEKNRQNGREQLAAVKKAAEELRKENADKSAARREEAEKVAEAQVRAIRLFDAMTDSAVTRGASEDQYAERIIERVRRLPQLVRDSAVAQLDTKYHVQRLDVLEKLEGFRQQASTQPADSEARRGTDQRIAAYESLLKATDAKYRAQCEIVKLTPLGQLSNSVTE